MSKSNNYIGIFDSGLGGLTVLKEIINTLPNENLLYFGDTARVPYGSKSAKTIERYAFENASFLSSKNIKALVVACNTASAYAAGKLKKFFPYPVLDVVDPAVEKAIAASARKKIAVLATKATINSNVYEEKILSKCRSAEVVSIACPLFVPLVEENLISHPATKMIVKDYLKPLKSTKVDVVLLGCTHYPLLKKMIQSEVGKEVKVIDSAKAIAENLSAILGKSSLKNFDGIGKVQFYVSDDPDKFRLLGKKYLGRSIDIVEHFVIE